MCIKHFIKGILTNRGDEMYSYTKKKKFPRRKMIVGLSALLVVAVAFLSYEYTLNKEKDTAVFQENDIPVLTLPASETKEKGQKPFQVEAKVVLDYFDGKDSDVESITEFEGVFRGNQGMDYALDNQAFDVMACFSGKVSDVKDDSVFGKSVTISTDDLDITYQSLGETSLKKGDEVKQGAIIGKAGANIYNKDLGNHLHIVTTKTGTIIDPETIFDKTIEEIK